MVVQELLLEHLVRLVLLEVRGELGVFFLIHFHLAQLSLQISEVALARFVLVVLIESLVHGNLSSARGDPLAVGAFRCTLIQRRPGVVGMGDLLVTSLRRPDRASELLRLRG